MSNKWGTVAVTIACTECGLTNIIAAELRKVDVDDDVDGIDGCTIEVPRVDGHWARETAPWSRQGLWFCCKEHRDMFWRKEASRTLTNQEGGDA